MRSTNLDLAPAGVEEVRTFGRPDARVHSPLHPAWFALIKLCRELGHGEIERLVIQDGLPVLVEVTRKKVRLT